MTAVSYTTLAQAAQDVDLQSRVTAAVHKEARDNATLGATDYGQAVINAQTSPALTFGWPVAVATEAAYEYAVTAGTPNPGGDPTVITDGDILSAVQAAWPMGTWPPPPITPPGP